MEVHKFVTKRWLGYFILTFVIWYPLSLVILTGYEVTGLPILFIAGNVFTPLLLLLMAYLYFRRARDDWQARLFTAFGWMALMFLFNAILVGPFYGLDWTAIINVEKINANWINVVAIIIGGTVAHRTPQEQIKIQGTNTHPDVKRLDG